MAKATQAGRLRGPDAAGGVVPGTNTPSESTSEASGGSPDAAEGGTPRAPEGVVIEGKMDWRPDDAEPGVAVGGFYVPRLRIASRSPAGFRRCGRRWGPEPVEVDADAFTEAEILRLLDEPELMVTAVTGALVPVAE